jgi:colanic acid/amylovoran biosynthesis protein
MMNDPQSFTGEAKTVISFLRWGTRNPHNQSLKFFWLAIVSVISILSYHLFRHPFFLPITSDIKDSIGAYLNADLVICTPGGYFYRYGRGRALIVFMLTIAFAILAKKPLYMLPQSFGPLTSQRERWLAKYLLKRARLIFTREEISLNYLVDWGIPKSSIHISPDMAFAFDGMPTKDAIDWLLNHEIDPQNSRPLLGVTVLDWGAQHSGFQNQSKYEEAICAAIRYFNKKYGGKVLFIAQSVGPTQVEDDRIPAQRISDKLGSSNDAIFHMTESISPMLLKSIYGQLDICIGTRMHANIFAISQYVPVLPIEYLPKTRGIAQTAGIADWVVDIYSITESMLIQKLESLWSEKDTVRKHLQAIIPQLIQDSLQACILIAEDFSTFREDTKSV